MKRFLVLAVLALSFTTAFTVHAEGFNPSGFTGVAGGGANPTGFVQPGGEMQIDNPLDVAVDVAYSEEIGPNRYQTVAWFQVKARSVSTFKFTAGRACFAVAINGQDRIKQLLGGGNFTWPNLGSLWANKHKATNSIHGFTGGASSNYLNATLNHGELNYNNSNLTALDLGLARLLLGMHEYRCAVVSAGNVTYKLITQ